MATKQPVVTYTDIIDTLRNSPGGELARQELCRQAQAGRVQNNDEPSHSYTWAFRNLVRIGVLRFTGKGCAVNWDAASLPDVYPPAREPDFRQSLVFG